MKSLIPAVAAIALVVVFGAGPAYASPFRECGNFGWRDATGTSRLGHEPD